MAKELDVSFCFEVNKESERAYEDLRKLWPGVSFFPFFCPEQKNPYLEFYRKLKQIIREAKREILNRAGLQSAVPADEIRYKSFINQPLFIHNQGFTNHLAQILRTNKYDFIQIEFIALAPLVYLLPSDCTKILVHHEIRFIRIKREMDLFRSIYDFDLCRLNIIADEETTLINKFDRVITLTGTDKKILSLRTDPSKIYVSPATIPLSESNNIQFIPFKNRLVFIGSSGHLPNTDGIDWFITDILPEISKLIPEIRLEIIGLWETDYYKRYRSDKVIFHGFIEDLDEYLSGSLMVVPIRIGSGMRLKILEAVNSKVPFISTSIGLEGLSFEGGTDCLIADTAEEFVKNICQLSGKEENQIHLVTNAYKKLKTELSFEKAITKRLDFYKSLS